MKKIFALSGILIVSVSLNSCRKTLDVNQNPNNPIDVTVDVLLPSTQTSIGQQVGNYFQVVGGIWAQYWTQNPNSSQYRANEQYQLDPSATNTAWSELYAGALTDLETIIKKADTTSALQNYKGIALIEEAYTYQLLTDNFGDIPFSEALKGRDRQTSPKYDAQEDVYNGIIAMAIRGRDLMDPSLPAPGSDDLIYNGDMDKWHRFANTLLLKMYLRLAYKNPGLAQQGITALNGADFIETGGTGQVVYTKQSGNSNPLYSELVNLNRTQNLIASSTSFDSLDSRGDSRIQVFYELVGVGLAQGFYAISTPGTYALPGVATGGLANPKTYGEDETVAKTAPVRFISSYESDLLQAEALARGWMTTGDPADLYSAAVHDNYAAFSLNDTLARDYVAAFPYPAGGTVQEQVEFIVTEKWYCMNGTQGIEAWTEWRRTGYPSFFVTSRASKLAPGVFPARLPYPQSELTLNAKFPGEKLISDKVWWDVN